MREKKSHIITHSDISVTKICVKNMCEKRVKTCEMCEMRENVCETRGKYSSISP